MLHKVGKRKVRPMLTLPKNHIYLLCMYMMCAGVLRVSTGFKLSEAYNTTDGRLTLNVDDGTTATHT